MFTLEITKEQVFKLIDQLSDNEQKEILQYLIEKTNTEDSQLEETMKIYEQGSKKYHNALRELA